MTGWATDVRAKAGLFLAFQYPEAIEGVSVTQFLRQAMAARKGTGGLGARGAGAHDRVDGAPRHGHVVRQPAPEPGVLAAARRSATRSCRWRCSSRWWRCSTRPTRASTSTRCASSAAACAAVRAERPELGVLAITHYERLLTELVPDVVHILMDGRVVASGWARAGGAGRGRRVTRPGDERDPSPGARAAQHRGAAQGLPAADAHGATAGPSCTSTRRPRRCSPSR